MEHYTQPVRRLILNIIVFLMSNFLIAQDSGYFTISIELETEQFIDKPKLPETIDNPSINDSERYFTISAEDDLTPKGDNGEKEEIIPSYFRHHKKFPKNFSGYVIELLQSEEELPRNYPLFNRFGNVHVSQLGNGNYSYCILIDFQKASRVKIFAKEVIQPLAPDAQTLRYKRGKRKKM